MSWVKRTLGEIYDDEKGSVQTGPFGSQLHESDYKETGNPVIMPKDIINDKLETQNIARINGQDTLRLSRHIVKKDDIVFPRRGDIGKRVLITDKEEGFLCGTGCLRLRGTGELISPQFLFLYLKQPKIVKWIENQAIGATMPNLNTSILRSVPVKYPPLPTQQKIASILSAYDDLIENNNQRIKLLEEMAEEIYKEWFVRLRFPNYENVKVVDGVPEGWKVERLRNCIQHYIGGGWGEEYPKGKSTVPAHVIRGTDIPDCNKGILNFDVLRYHTESNLSSRRCKAKDIIFEVSGGTEEQSLGRTVFITSSMLERFGEDLIAASFCKLIRIDNSVVSPFYIHSILKRMLYTGELKVYQVQSTGISNYQFEDFIDATKILIPTVEIQEKFNEIISNSLNEIQLLGQKNELLQQTRDLLLPRLISGKLSVEDINIEYPETQDKLNSAVESSRNMAAEPTAPYN